MKSETVSFLKSKVFIISVIVLLIGAITDNLVGQKINTLFPDRQPITDVLFIVLPYIESLGPWSDIANIFSCIILALYLFPKRYKELPFALTVLGLGYVIRGFVILLNPFGGPLGNEVHYGLTTIHQYGQFPSGHMFLVTAIYLMINSEQKLFKNLALISVFVEGASLILSHGHYSIDIIGGLALGYFAFNILLSKKHYFIFK